MFTNDLYEFVPLTLNLTVKLSPFFILGKLTLFKFPQLFISVYVYGFTTASPKLFHTATSELIIYSVSFIVTDSGVILK